MGFGLFLVGYMTLLLLKMVPIEIVGFFVMYLALDKLQNQEPSFKYAKYASIYMFLESALGAMLWLSPVRGCNIGFISEPYFITVENILYHSGLLVFHLLLYMAIRNISQKVGYTKAVGRARFGAVAICIFYVAQICSAIIPGAEIMMAPLGIYQILLMLFNLFILVGCYMMIVTDEMLEKEEKKYNEFLEKNKKFKKDKKEWAKKTISNNTKKSKNQKQTFKATRSGK